MRGGGGVGRRGGGVREAARELTGSLGFTKIAPLSTTGGLIKPRRSFYWVRFLRQMAGVHTEMTAFFLSLATCGAQPRYPRRQESDGEVVMSDLAANRGSSDRMENPQGLPSAHVQVEEGDTDTVPHGLETHASRSTPPTRTGGTMAAFMLARVVQ